jgi:hypothetical protein
MRVGRRLGNQPVNSLNSSSGSATNGHGYNFESKAAGFIIHLPIGKLNYLMRYSPTFKRMPTFVSAVTPNELPGA